MSTTPSPCEQEFKALHSCTYVFLESYKYNGRSDTIVTDQQLDEFRQCMKVFYTKYPERCEPTK
jgi:hypothetical protein